MSPTERETLITELLPEVAFVAKTMHRKFSKAVPAEMLQHVPDYDDLYQQGVIGLIHAVDRFDPNGRASLKTFAHFRIRGEILDYVRSRKVDYLTRDHRLQVHAGKAPMPVLVSMEGRIDRAAAPCSSSNATDELRRLAGIAHLSIIKTTILKHIQLGETVKQIAAATGLTQTHVVWLQRSIVSDLKKAAHNEPTQATPKRP